MTKYCKPSDTGLNSTDSEVCKRLGTLIEALSDEITNRVVEGEIVSDIQEFRAQLLDRLQAEGWTMSYDGGNKLKVRQPGHKKPFPNRFA